MVRRVASGSAKVSSEWGLFLEGGAGGARE